jgi:hypothetical protein
MFLEMRPEKFEPACAIFDFSTKPNTTITVEDPKPTPFFPNFDSLFNKSYISGKDKPKKYLSKKDLSSKNDS